MLESKTGWNNLVGRTVEVRKGGRLIRVAEVEEATPDASIIWLSPSGNDARQIIASWDEFEIRLIS